MKKQLTFDQTMRNILAVLLLLVMFIGGCNSEMILSTVFPDTATPMLEQKPDIAMTTAPTDETLEAMEPIESTGAPLIIWVPPQFDPYQETDQGSMMQEQITTFLDENPSTEITVRVKPVAGPGSLLDTLVNAAQVAKASLPTIVLLPRSDMERAAAQGLLTPIDAYTERIDDTDWYPFAVDMAIIQGEIYGIPFLANALGFITAQPFERSELYSIRAVQTNIDRVVFPAGDIDSIIPILFYASTGGSLFDAQGQVQLDSEALADTFEQLAGLIQSNVFPKTLLEVTSHEAAVEQFQSGAYDGLITWVNGIDLEEQVKKLNPVPTFGDDTLTYAKGWVWCVVETEDEHQEEQGIRLVEHLTEAGFLSSITPASGYLPVRPSTLPAWESTGDPTAIDWLLTSAQLIPSHEELSQIKTVFNSVFLEILSGNVNAVQAADKVLEQMEAPKTP